MPAPTPISTLMRTLRPTPWPTLKPTLRPTLRPTLMKMRIRSSTVAALALLPLFTACASAGGSPGGEVGPAGAAASADVDALRLALDGYGPFEVRRYADLPAVPEFSRATIYYPANASTPMGGVAIASGDIVVADNDGVVIVPRQRTSEVLGRLPAIRAAESALETKVKDGLEIPDFIQSILASDRILQID